MNRAGPSVNIQVRLKYQDFLKNPVELGPGIASQVRAASPGRGYLGPRAAGPPSNARDNPVAWGPGWVPGPAGPRGRRHGRPLRLGPPCGWPAPPRWPRSCWRPTGERPKDSRRARPRQRSSPASNSNRGAGNNHVFFKIDVGFSGQVWSSQVREAKSRCQVKRAGRLLLSAPQLAARVPGLRGVIAVGSKIKFLREGGPNDGWLTSTANSGSGPASLVRRLASISLRPALRIRERNNDLRRGPDLLSFLCTRVGVSP